MAKSLRQILNDSASSPPTAPGHHRASKRECERIAAEREAAFRRASPGPVAAEAPELEELLDAARALRVDLAVPPQGP